MVDLRSAEWLRQLAKASYERELTDEEKARKAEHFKDEADTLFDPLDMHRT